jgi:hypothetical protein
LVGRRTEEALDAFLDRVRHTAACITALPILINRTGDPGQPYEARFAPRGGPARLRTDSGRRIIFFEFTFSLNVVQPVDPRTNQAVNLVSYEQRILDRDDREILAFHWHPSGLSDITDPHMHLSSRLNPIEMGRNQEPLPLADMHIPTGFVTLEDVVRLLISEFGIRPRHTGWDAILRANRALALAEQAG